MSVKFYKVWIVAQIRTRLDAIYRSYRLEPTHGGVQYTREETRKWKELFTNINTGNDNHKNPDNRVIDPREYIEYARSEGLALNDKEAEQWFNDMDKNHNGKVSFKEFINEFGKKFENQRGHKKDA
ncbi:hypothetical protein BDV27DRAFT_158767 [Aspergillus caelatus]|uniref:EF-hand domain-containing protein n=1 Tax=Aspergillus caelatus TaxID=61420 RepID=A0A5N7A1V8_9EURO|nr:uncharacterized protein BDV27DRAFT_158767 [Aspergillus caelatus]KAE8363448.1 hypothetical protein BDV27DRAFT_158767 [Aspergillus caelatus]